MRRTEMLPEIRKMRFEEVKFFEMVSCLDEPDPWFGVVTPWEEE